MTSRETYLRELLATVDEARVDGFLASALTQHLVGRFEAGLRRACEDFRVLAPYAKFNFPSFDEKFCGPRDAGPHAGGDDAPAASSECAVAVTADGPGAQDDNASGQASPDELRAGNTNEAAAQATRRNTASGQEWALAPPPSPVREEVGFRLRNARQGEPYAATVETTEVGPSGRRVSVYDVILPVGLGIGFSRAGSRVEGTPLKSGEFVVPIRYRFSDDPPETQRTGNCSLYVNPDPRSLWKNIPSDPAALFWKPDEAHCFVPGGADERRIVAARKRGRSHAQVGSCCDDDFRIASHDGWSIAIVADGAGSAKLSRRGSQVVVNASCEALCACLDGAAAGSSLSATQEIEEACAAFDADPSEANRRRLHLHLYATVGYSAHAALRALHAEAMAYGAGTTERDFATTLLIGISRRVGTKWLCAAYWVGDGAIGVFRDGEGVELLGEVDAGEFSGQTRFLDASEVGQQALLARTRFVIVDSFTAFVLMTDGVSDAKFDSELALATVAPWTMLWSELERECKPHEEGNAAPRLLSWLDFWSPGNHDDRTIAIIY